MHIMMIVKEILLGHFVGGGTYMNDAGFVWLSCKVGNSYTYMCGRKRCRLALARERKEMNHSKRFYVEVLRVFPEYYRWHSWLKSNGDDLINK